jgi:hypothetical protein
LRRARGRRDFEAVSCQIDGITGVVIQKSFSLFHFLQAVAKCCTRQ